MDTATRLGGSRIVQDLVGVTIVIDRRLDLDFKRIQFADLMPSGHHRIEILDEHKTFRFNRGHYLPTSFWLMRLTEHHKTQACTARTMQRAVRHCEWEPKHLLAKPFFVLATKTQLGRKALIHCPKTLAWTVLCSTSNLTTPAIRKRSNVVKNTTGAMSTSLKSIP